MTAINQDFRIEQGTDLELLWPVFDEVDRRAVWDAGTGSAMGVGDVITTTGGVRAVVTRVVTEGGATGTFAYYLTIDPGDLTPPSAALDFVDNDAFISDNRLGVINGTPIKNPIDLDSPSKTFAFRIMTNPWDATASKLLEITGGSPFTTADHDGDGDNEVLVMPLLAADTKTFLALTTPIQTLFYDVRYIQSAIEVVIASGRVNLAASPSR